VTLSWATTVQPVALPELVQRSATIVHGTVLETHSQWEQGGGQIYTYVTLAPKEVLKGAREGVTSVTFRQIGGQVGDRVVYVPGTPRFSAKQEVLVFLTGPDSAGFPQVMGIYQGAFRPGSTVAGQRRVDALSPDAVTSLLPEKPRFPGKSAPATPLEGSFGDFLQRIRDLAREQAKGPAR
jgi:hypothetical protein